MTPMTLWQGYNPTTEPLDVVVNGVKNNEKYVSKEVSFTAETVADGKIRAYANIVVQKKQSRADVFISPERGVVDKAHGVF